MSKNNQQRTKKRMPVTLLIEKLNSIDEASRNTYAEKCGTSFGNLRQIAYGYGGCSPALAKKILENCECDISFEQLIPEANLVA